MSKRTTPADVTSHSLEAERALLGAILVDERRFFDVVGLVDVSDFFRDAHRRIFAHMKALAEAHQPIDFLTLLERLKQAGEIDDVGGPAYLAQLPDGVPGGINVEAYAGIVKDRATRAQLMRAARQIIHDAQHSTENARELLDRAQASILSIADQNHRADFIDADELVARGAASLQRRTESRSEVTGIASGFIDLDTLTCGFQPGTLVIIAARPSMGKSAFALNAAYHAARRGHVVGFLSPEMSLDELFVRLVSAAGDVDGGRLQTGRLLEKDFARVAGAFAEISRSGLCVDDSSVLSVLDARSKARRLKARRGLDLLVIDYLQLMQTSPGAENRNVAIAEISRGLKQLARELNVPVVALSQLSRANEQRGNKEPMLSDLRDSGSLEQDADLVVFIHRQERYERDPAPEVQDVADIIIAKQRNGPVGRIKLQWSKETTQFRNLVHV